MRHYVSPLRVLRSQSDSTGNAGDAGAPPHLGSALLFLLDRKAYRSLRQLQADLIQTGLTPTLLEVCEALDGLHADGKAVKRTSGKAGEGTLWKCA